MYLLNYAFLYKWITAVIKIFSCPSANVLHLCVYRTKDQCSRPRPNCYLRHHLEGFYFYDCNHLAQFERTTLFVAWLIDAESKFALTTRWPSWVCVCVCVRMCEVKETDTSHGLPPTLKCLNNKMSRTIPTRLSMNGVAHLITEKKNMRADEM